MRCEATVSANSVLIRAHGSPTDPQCRRQAKANGLCLQHAALRYCQARGCDERAATREGDRWFCRHHARLYAVHNRIVERILSIPARD